MRQPMTDEERRKEIAMACIVLSVGAIIGLLVLMRWVFFGGLV